MSPFDIRRRIRLLPIALALLVLAAPVAGGLAPGASVAAAQSTRTPIWDLGGPEVDEVRHVATDAAGQVYVAGVFAGTLDVDPGPGRVELVSNGDADIFVAKYSPSGVVVWAWSIGGTGRDDVRQIAVDSADSVYIAGSIVGEVDFAPDDDTALVEAGRARQGFVAKYDADGALLWASALDLPGSDEVLALALDGVGNALVAGWSGIIPVGHPASWSSGAAGAVRRGDLFVLRLDPSGRVGWSAVLPTGSEGIAPVGLAVGPGGAVHVAASFTGAVRVLVGEKLVEHASAGGADLLLLRLTPSGGLDWSRAVGGDGHDVPVGLAVDGDGNLAVTGTFNGALDVGGDGALVLEAEGEDDAFLLSFDGSGEPRWGVRLGGPGYDGGQAVAVDAARYVYVAGWFAGRPAMERAPDRSRLRARGRNGATDALIAKYTPDGELAWVRGFGGKVAGAERSSAATALALDWRGDVVLGGRFWGAVDFDPGAAVRTLTSRGASDGFVVRLGPDGSLVRR